MSEQVQRPTDNIPIAGSGAVIVDARPPSLPAESEVTTSRTSNGHEIAYPREVLGLVEFKNMLNTYGLAGDTPVERIEALRSKSKEFLAIFMTDLNARLNGSTETLVSDKTMKIGEQSAIAPEERYDLFSRIIEKVKATPEDINPARIGDALALSIVLLHPFKDGNGRTARMLGYMFREDMDGLDALEDFRVLVEPRDTARERGGYMINGYVPYIGKGADQYNPVQVASYIGRVLSSDEPGLYTGPYGQAELRTTTFDGGKAE